MKQIIFQLFPGLLESGECILRSRKDQRKARRLGSLGISSDNPKRPPLLKINLGSIKSLFEERVFY